MNESTARNLTNEELAKATRELYSYSDKGVEVIVNEACKRFRQYQPQIDHKIDLGQGRPC